MNISISSYLTISPHSYYLGLHTDNLVLFAQPNEEVVPLADTTTTHHNNNTTTAPASHCLYGELWLMTMTAMVYSKTTNECKAGPNDASHCLGSGMFLLLLFFSTN
jgi:hypothetical protein